MAEPESRRKKPCKSKEKKTIRFGAKTKGGREETAFPIVGIGASAGGLQAIETFFAMLPADCNMAFVIVRHLPPHHESLMNSLLSKETPLQVNNIRDGIPIEINQVYISPPGKDVVIQNRTLYLQEAQKKNGLHFTIDTFFRSLAEDQKEKSVCIVLTGANNDGTLGARLIKGEGGVVIVQEEQQAQYPRMPKSVIDAGLADIILPVEKMPEHLSRLRNHPFMTTKPVEYPPTKNLENDIQSILMLVRTQTGQDFSQYKQNTVLRRIRRRMALNHINEMNDYRRYLRQNTQEVSELFSDLTINVTSFFRDNKAFLALLKKGIKPLMEKKKTGSPFRVWVPGCSSGEEAYSLAILLIETAEQMEKSFDFRIFGTDINTDVLGAARRGEFLENIEADISGERLKRFFTKRGNSYYVDSRIREAMVFADHDVTRDPPFSNLDLISCRNLLIYMDNDLQKRVFRILHYSLKPAGILFLGSSETVGETSEVFAHIDNKNKIYQRKDVDIKTMQHFRAPLVLGPMREKPEMPQNKRQRTPNAQEKDDARALVESAFAEKYAPPAVLINKAYDILYLHGETGRYLSLPKGEANLNLFRLINWGGGGHFRLSQALETAKSNKEPARIDRVQIRHNDESLSLDLVCTPLFSKKDNARYILVEFQEHLPKETGEKKRPPQEEGEKSLAVTELEQELLGTRQELKYTIEKCETANEELKSSNEELLTNNEELQSTIEALESSKEEIQSTNEELETLNTELSKKNQELMKVEEDLNNLIAFSEVGTVLLDSDLCINRFTSEAKAVFNLDEERDIGRSIRDITNKMQYSKFAEDAEEVLDKLTRKEIKIHDHSGNWFVVRIFPYRTQKNVISGVVITFMDIIRYGASELYVQDAKNFFYQTLSALWEPILILDESLNIVTANRAFLRTFKTTPKETENRFIFELGDNQWDIPELRKFLSEIIPRDNEFEGYEVMHDFPGIGRRNMSLNARKISQGEERPTMILLGFRDITADR